MTSADLITELRSSLDNYMPLPAGGHTSLRHRRLMEIGRGDLSLARLAEAHWDAVAILAEAGRFAQPGVLYGVWASEIPGQALELNSSEHGLTIRGSKKFCSGAGLIDRVLLTIGLPEHQLVDLDLRQPKSAIEFDYSSWKTSAFQETRTATVTFDQVPIEPNQIVGDTGWYLNRIGFWHGACGPPACWAGGAEGLIDYALRQSRHDAHTLAHLGAMQSSLWALRTYLDRAGQEIDENPNDVAKARRLALVVRHLVEQACSDILHRLTRAYGPHPLALDEDISLRYQELDLFLRQCHAERDLESLGREFLLVA